MSLRLLSVGQLIDIGTGRLHSPWPAKACGGCPRLKYTCRACHVIQVFFFFLLTVIEGILIHALSSVPIDNALSPMDVERV